MTDETIICPACGIDATDNGLIHRDDEYAGPKMTHEWECMACGHNFGEDTGRQGGYKIEADRPSANGVTARSTGTDSRKVWDECERRLTEGTFELRPVAKIIVAWAVEQGIAKSLATTEYYRWKKFRGL